MNGRQIAVTGRSSGTSLKICERSAASSDHGHVVDRDPPPGTVPYTRRNVSAPASIQAAAALPDTIDVLVNAAGVSGLAGLPATMTVNFSAVPGLTTARAPRMPQGSPVANTTSTSGRYWRGHLADIREVLAARTEDETSAVMASRIPDGHAAYARGKEGAIVWSAGWLDGTGIPVDHGAEMAGFLAAQDLITPPARA